MKHDLMLKAFTAMLTMVPVTSASAQQGTIDEASFLQAFEGRFTGTGKLENAGGSSHNLNCRFDGDQQGSRVTLTGSCSTALIFSTTVRIDLRYDPRTQRYDGKFREGKGTIANLAGARRGDNLALSFRETAESVRPNPPATLTISRHAEGLVLALRGSQPGQGQNLDLRLSEN
ncbi:hypothetical protein FG93_05767 [Bosea sp. LC85]|uniref:hypothetical protein n=1 Tax=Bosea sp. LC85 TaxID=1502851 RepID=UPI0004E3C9DA|nr:hypothetical protein [Bosea sp. LC85]KFC63641.1 hypothetical protein FG93_05767 [Bosea sp. LC85]